MLTLTYRYLSPSIIQPDDINAVGRLMLQLTGSSRPVSQRLLENVYRGSTLLVARDSNERIVAMATLSVSSPALTGVVGSIKDVAVDESLRGQGVEQRLVEHLVLRARQMRLDWLEGVCQSSSVPMNEVYEEEIGFERKEASSWILEFHY
jgi:ribosomal protein S18 acetylase RimI-like enzyme